MQTIVAQNAIVYNKMNFSGPSDYLCYEIKLSWKLVSQKTYGTGKGPLIAEFNQGSALLPIPK